MPPPMRSRCDSRDRIGAPDRCPAGLVRHDFPVTGITRRLARRVGRDFGSHASQVTRRLESLELCGHADVERVLAAVVLCARGDLRRLEDAASLAALDWRDVLVGADLADADWAARLDAALDPVPD